MTTKARSVRPYPHFKFPSEITIAYEVLNNEHCKWYGVPEGSIKLSCENYGWFPVELIAGVEGKKFSETSPLSKKTGFVQANGNLGFRSATIKACKLDVCLTILETVGYIVK